MSFVVNGWVDPWLPEAEGQHEIIGGVLAAAAMQFARGGYTIVADGHLFPQGVEGLAGACVQQSVPLHYVVLRADLATCLARARRRGEGRWALEPATFGELHARLPMSASTKRTSLRPWALPPTSPPAYSRHSGRADSQ